MALIKPLSPAEKRVLRSASANAMEAALPSGRRFFRRGRIMGPANPYFGAGINRLAKDVASGSATTKEFPEYLSAAALQHAADGWSYVGSALHSTVRGDPQHALHLAYYASLRAANALLASRGIAILNMRHFVVNKSSAVVKIPSPSKGRGTHQMAWLALEHWADRLTSGDLLSEIIRPGGTPLKEWLQAGFGGTPWRRVARGWIETWGVDLRRFGQDQTLRNAASYRPSGLAISPTGAEAAATFVDAVWDALRPSSLCPFDWLDRHLLRLVLEDLEFQTSGVKPPSAAFDVRIASILGRLAPAGTDWMNFLTRRVEPEDLAILSASNRPLAAHLQVIARSVLLLRLATGAGLRLRSESGVSGEALYRWSANLLVARGVWDPSAPFTDPLDPWSDAEAARTGLAAVLGPGIDYRALNQSGAVHLHQLAGAERAAVWGITS